MKVSAQMMDSHLSRKIKTYDVNDKLIEDEGLTCKCNVHIDRAWLCYGSEREHYRPRLRLVGKITSIEGTFPDNVTSMDFGEDEARQPGIEFLYEFDNAELAELCEKGLFDDGFKIPSIIEDNDYQIPVKCNYRLVPREHEGDVPICFIQVDNQFCIDTSAFESGYRLADYFEHAEVEELVEDNLVFEEMEDEAEKLLFEAEPEVKKKLSKKNIM